MKGWKQIVRRIHSAKPIEDRADPAISLRSRKRKPQWKKQETDSSDDNRCRDSFSEGPQFAIGPTKKWRANKEEIDRHVRENHERNEWDGALPFEIERADVNALSGDPIATDVDAQKQDR